MSLFWRILLANAAILVAAVVVLAISPLTVSHPINVVEAFVLVIGLIVLFAVNWWLVSRVMRPLNELRRRVEQIESSDTAVAVDVRGAGELAAIASAFNAMLDRLERERTDATRRVLQAQEAERARVSSELHDEVGSWGAC